MQALSRIDHAALHRASYQLLHDIPGRCRIRVARMRTDAAVREGVRQRLANSSLVSSFRFNPACESVTIEHVGQVDALFDMLLQPSLMSVALLPTPLPTMVSDKQEAGPVRAMAWAATALVLGPAGGFGLDLVLIVLTGLPIWRRAVSTLFNERRLNVDFLDGLALAIAVLRREPRTAALMAMMVHLGDVVRELTARQSRGHIRELLDFQTLQARRLEADGRVSLIPAQSLRCDDMALMLAGDLVPADGMISSGVASVDQRHITGESVPATRRVGDMVFAGSSIVEGAITVQVTEVGAATVVAKIVQVIEAAPVGETRIQNYAEQFADRLVAPLLGVNVAMLALTGNVDRFMSMAIVDYGTGIRVAAPTSILASMTRAARQGILIKSGHHVEQLATLRLSLIHI
jgi:cation-transporting P-type ATPase C